MTLLIVSFIAGVLTVLAPCVLPLLPVVIGSSAAGRSRWTPYVVTGSLALSVILFTFLLKASTALIMVPPEVWAYLSGGILVIFGVALFVPGLWERLPFVSAMSRKSNAMLGTSARKKGLLGDAAIGLALGPIFSTCSPTYFVILASVLPVSFARGVEYILAYVAGLSLLLLAIGLVGQKFASKLDVFANPHGWLKRGIGVLFIVLGLAIALGFEKKLEVAILDSGFFDITKVEQRLLKQVDFSATGADNTGGATSEFPRYTEITDPSGFVNTDGITLGELIGKKVVLVDFMTYSCINCQRTFPHLVEWYEKYSDEGLEIVGVHTPEFAFEKDINNVHNAMVRFGITYPVVLDNDYATWRAYGNQFWPRKYLIDIDGRVVYDHIGEGDYEETEAKIRELLVARAAKLGEPVGADTAGPMSGGASAESEAVSGVGSPEIYFGAARNEFLGNGAPGAVGEQTFALPEAGSVMPNTLYLGGAWNITPEYVEASGAGEHAIVFRYRAKNVYFVASGDGAALEILLDGKPVSSRGGADVGAASRATIDGETLYHLVADTESAEHTLEIRVLDPGLKAYTFTFG